MSEVAYAAYGPFEATYWQKADRYYLYLHNNNNRVGQINSGKTPEEVYGSIEGWVNHVVKRSQKRIDKINEQLTELNVEKAGLDSLLKAAKDADEEKRSYLDVWDEPSDH